MTYEFTKIKDAQPTGQRQLTEIDTRKAEADILIHYVFSKGFTIEIKNKSIKVEGRGVRRVCANGYIDVTKTKLAELERKYDVRTDF